MINVTNRPYSFYGNFYDTTTQTASANTATPMLFNTTVESQGVTVTSGSQVNILNSGTYNIQFSAQLDKPSANSVDLDIWLQTNAGTVIPWSNTRLTLAGNAKGVAAWNFVQTFTGGDHFHIYWSNPDAVSLYAGASATSPTRPAIPSVILTVTQV